MTLNDKAYGQILEGLLSGDLAPGAMLTESQAVEQYGLTLAPVRAALHRLSQEGWLIAQPRRGYLIKPLTIADTRDLFLMRKLIEPPAARLAARRIDTARLSELDAVCTRGFQLGDRAAEDAFFAANKAFHLGIAEASGSRRIVEAVRILQNEAERVLRFGMRHLNWSDNWNHGHSELLDALAQKDGVRAEEVALKQLETSEDVVMKALMLEAEDLPLGVA